MHVKLPIVYKLTPDSQPKGIDKELDKRGYITIDETSVRILEMDHYCQAKAENIHIAKATINCSGFAGATQPRGSLPKLGRMGMRRATGERYL